MVVLWVWDMGYVYRRIGNTYKEKEEEEEGCIARTWLVGPLPERDSRT
jgi:hypothetical protein